MDGSVRVHADDLLIGACVADGVCRDLFAVGQVQPVGLAGIHTQCILIHRQLSFFFRFLLYHGKQLQFSEGREPAPARVEITVACDVYTEILHIRGVDVVHQRFHIDISRRFGVYIRLASQGDEGDAVQGVLQIESLRSLFSQVPLHGFDNDLAHRIGAVQLDGNVHRVGFGCRGVHVAVPSQLDVSALDDGFPLAVHQQGLSEEALRRDIAACCGDGLSEGYIGQFCVVFSLSHGWQEGHGHQQAEHQQQCRCFDSSAKTRVCGGNTVSHTFLFPFHQSYLFGWFDFITQCAKCQGNFGNGRKKSWRAESPAAPAFSFASAPIPPTPFPSGEGGDYKLILPGAPPPAPRHQTAYGTDSPCRCSTPAGGGRRPGKARARGGG